MTTAFNGLHMGLGNLSLLSDAESRSMSPENFTGERGGGGRATEGTGAAPARDLGQGWKISPSIILPPGKEIVLADITGSGQIQHIWMVPLNCRWRHLILRFYWDGQEHPSVEVPYGDFFALGWEKYAQVNSLPVTVNPGRGFNCFWPMPFSNNAKITITNQDDAEEILYYQIDYCLCEIPKNAARFHAQFNRMNPNPYKEDYLILTAAHGKGHYVGTYLAWGVNNNGWWGEGEIKFFIDDDKDFPTICGTGTEDYFLGAYNFDVEGKYTEFSTPFAGLPQVIRPDGTYSSQQRFGMYRWHIMDPIRFKKALRVRIQDLGWIPSLEEKDRRYLPQQSDIASTAFWYQTLPSQPLPPLQSKDYLQVI